MDVVISKEKLSSGEPVYVSHCVTLGLASQGMSPEEAIANIKEAIALYLEEQPEKYDELGLEEPPLFSVVEVTKNAKAASAVGQ
ncbi:type II toxin-antitoxin system HicB family antitoxin [Candidatus Woesearchaeota archaeon]|nr:type II toxin-antitoxin system HicB family antitoxin [Candidatus Woesearchaeota archaeon]